MQVGSMLRESCSRVVLVRELLGDVRLERRLAMVAPSGRTARLNWMVVSEMRADL